jgi:hypothetical protein
MLGPSTETLLFEALKLLVAALELIDRAEAPGEIGAYIDHARARICEILGTPDSLDDPDLEP